MRLDSLARDLVVYGSLINKQFKKDLKSTINNSFAVRYRKQIQQFIQIKIRR